MGCRLGEGPGFKVQQDHGIFKKQYKVNRPCSNNQRSSSAVQSESNFPFLYITRFQIQGKGCHHDTLLHIWYCNVCSKYRFQLIFFFLIDRCGSQAALMQVSSTLLNSDSRRRVKCENIFCAAWWQITSHNDTASCYEDTHLKSIENSEASMTQPAKNFQTKRFCTSDRNVTFVVLF